jgi:hypothetical protein
MEGDNKKRAGIFIGPEFGTVFHTPEEDDPQWP